MRPGRGMGRQQKQGRRGLGLGGSDICTCSECGYQESHTRNIPCAQVKCPKCGTRMMGEICKD